MIGWIIVLVVIIIYILILYVLHKKGVFKGERLSLFGPFLMLKTKRGRGFIDKLAKLKRFWSAFGWFAIVLCLIVMISITVMLIWTAFLVPSIPVESAPSPQMILGIPGLNPLIPLWYGILALIISIVLHEFSHGILTRVAKLKIKSLGLLFFVIPIGAFVEPDEEALKNTERRKRMKVFASGPAINIIFALVFALIFSWGFMGSVVPKHDGVVVRGVLTDIPNTDAGLTAWSEITHIDGERISNISDYYDYYPPGPNETINMTVFYRGSFKEINNVTSGVFLTYTLKDYPAEAAGLKARMIIAGINGTEIRAQHNVSQALDLTRANQNVIITVYEFDEGMGYYVKNNKSVVLADKYEYLEEFAPSQNKEEYRGKGFLGINSAYLGITVEDIHSIPHRLTHPFAGVDSFETTFAAGVYYISLPFPQVGLSPLQSPVTDLYDVSGPLGALPDSVFWPMANIFYWMFWINLMLGATNCLPAVPLDGGYVFKINLEPRNEMQRSRLARRSQLIPRNAL